MKLAFITDEMTQSFDEALEFAISHQLDGLELRSVEDTPIDAIDVEKLAFWRRRLDDSGLATANLASTFFKCLLEDEAAIQENHEKLNRLCDRADILGCGTIRGFTFFSAGSFEDVLPKILEKFQKPLQILQQHDKTLLLEADPSVNGTNHTQLARFIEALGSPRVKAIYDPGNDVYDPLGEMPYPGGYAAIRPHLAHVHIKDAVKTASGPKCVKVGTGLVDYPGLLAAFVRDGYEGWLSLETHYRAGQRLTEEQMRLPQGEAFSQGGRMAMEESLASLRALLKNAGETGL